MDRAARPDTPGLPRRDSLKGALKGAGLRISPDVASTTGDLDRLLMALERPDSPRH